MRIMLMVIGDLVLLASSHLQILADALNRPVLTVRENERRNIADYIYRLPQTTIQPSIEDTAQKMRQ